MALKIIFAGTSDFAVAALEKLLKSEHEILAVYTQPDRPAGRGLKLKASPVKEAALRHNLPVYQPESLKDPATQTTLKACNADIMVVVVYGLLIPPAVLTAFRLGCVNVHPSLLPKWRGAAPIQRAIAAGDSQTGVTIMQLDEGWDSGDILLQVNYPISPNDTAGSLHEHLAELGASLLVQAIDGLAANTIRPVAQNHEQAVYAPKIDKSEGKIDWQQDAATLERKIRAFNPWPVAYAEWDNQVLRIWEAQVLPEERIGAKPGLLLALHDAGIDVATGAGVLRLLKLQLPGGKPLAAADFIHARGKQLHPLKTHFS